MCYSNNVRKLQDFMKWKWLCCMLTMKVMFNNAFLLPLRGSYNFKKYAKCALSSFNNLNRIPANDKSFSVNTLALNPDLLRSQLVCRKIANSEVIVENVVSLRDQRNAIIKRTDDIKHEKKLLSDQIGSLIRSDGDKDNIAKLTAQSKEMDAILVIEDTKLTEISNTLSKLVMSIPNFLDDRVPEGNGEEDNKVVFEWGYDLRKIGDTYQWHDDLAVALGGLDPEAAIKMSGSRFSVLKGGLAQLERAIIQYFLDFHTSRGYTECSVPFIVTRGALEGTGQLPKFEEDLFKLHHQALNSDTFLIPTAEVPLTNIYKDCILESSDLPIKLVSHTPSFRSEVGNHGRDTRGLLRQHQFHKVELVKLVTPETSDQEHEAMCQDAELLLQSLLLPYRKVLLCSGDLGFTARICYDLEVWLPGQQLFREISSISNCYDFQANRMNVRYRPLPKGAKKTGKKSTAPIHTLNGSGLAVGRTLVAIIENYQNSDGSVTIPNVLQSYMGGLKLLEPKTKK